MGGPLQLKYKFPGFFFLNGATSCLFPRNEKRTHSKMAGESHFWGEGRKSRKRLQKVVLCSKADKLKITYYNFEIFKKGGFQSGTVLILDPKQRN